MAPFDLPAWLAASPMPPPIVQAGALVLRHRALDVPREFLGTPSLDRLVEVMVETMRAAPGVGLAAPQIGVPLRVFVAEDTEERLAHVDEEARRARARTALPLMVVVNPRLDLEAGSEATFYEGCLSVRGYAALVRRATVVTLSGTDAHGGPVSARLEGWPARILQHETDHLDGVLYVDRMISRSFASDTEFGSLAGMAIPDLLHELGVPPC